MPFEKIAEVAPGVTGAFHKAISRNVSGTPGVDSSVTLYSYATRDDLEKQGFIVFSSSLPMTSGELRAALLAGDWPELESIERWLIANRAPFIGGSILADGAEETLESAKTKRNDAVSADYDRATAQALSGYTEVEQKTFFVQISEAQAWKADNSAPTPFLDGALAGNGREKGAFVDSILAANALYSAEAGRILGLSQAARAAIAAATSIEEVNQVIWNFGTATSAPPAEAPAETPPESPAPTPAPEGTTQAYPVSPPPPPAPAA